MEENKELSPSQNWPRLHWVAYFYIWTTLPLTAIVSAVGFVRGLVELFRWLVWSKFPLFLERDWMYVPLWFFVLAMTISSYGLYRRWSWAIRFSARLWLVAMVVGGILSLVCFFSMLKGSSRVEDLAGFAVSFLWFYAWFRYFRWFKYPAIPKGEQA